MAQVVILQHVTAESRVGVRSIHVRYILDTVSLGQVFFLSQCCGIACQNNSTAAPYLCSSECYSGYRTSGGNMGALRKNSAL